MATIDVAVSGPRQVFKATAGDTLRIKFNTGPAQNSPGSIEVHAQGGQNFELSGKIVDASGASFGAAGPSATVKINFTLKPNTDYWYEVSIPADSGAPPDAGLECNYVQPMDRPGHGVAHHGWLDGVWHSLRGR